jgi:hypothetical protein
MRKTLIFLFIINNVILLFADGTQERDKQPYEQIQLKVVNLTDQTINFYFNKLYGAWGYDRWQIRSNEEFVTMNTPINNDYPGFIGIQYNNLPGHQINNEIVIYQYNMVLERRMSKVNRQYFVLVMESGIQFIEGNIDEEIDYFDESLYQDTYWVKIRLGQRFVELIITNNSGSRKMVRISTVLEDQREILIGNRMTEIYTIDYNLYLFGGINISVFDSGWTVDRINFRNSRFRDYETLNKINLRLNANGHEVSYN